MTPPRPASQALSPEFLVWLLIGGMAICHLAVAVSMPLSGDEAYYWLWTRRLQLSYVDHPPMVAYWIYATTALLGDTVLAVRLPSVLASAAVTWLVYDTARRIFDSARVGLATAFWLNATILFAAAAVVITPDAPLLLFWSLALWALVRLVREDKPQFLLLAALALGLGGLSKYTMALMVPGVLAVFVLFPGPRRWWRRWPLYAGAGLALACTLPVVVWNQRNGWVSFTKQLDHAYADVNPQPLAGLLGYVGTQFGVITPLMLPFCLWGAGWALWAGWRRGRGDIFLLGAVSLPVILFFANHSLNGNIQAHWAGPAYLAACMAAVGGWASAVGPARPRLDRLWRAAPLLGAVLVAAIYLQAVTALVPLPPRVDPMKRLGGWPELAQVVAEQRQAHPGVFLFTIKHETMALLGFHIADHPQVFLAATRVPPSADIRHDLTALPGRDGLFIARADDIEGARIIGRYFAEMTKVRSVDRKWGGKVVESFDIYLGRDYRPGLFGETQGGDRP